MFFDNNATTRPLPEVVDAMMEIYGARFGNASSAHSGGDEARRSLSQARASVAELLNADSEQVLFTSSGTEANNMALLSGLRRKGGASLITSSIEHSSIIKMAQYLETAGTNVVYLRPSRSGRIRAEDLLQSISQFRPELVSIQWVNSETGVIQPAEEIASICRQAGVMLHMDAAQAVGKLPLSVAKIDADIVTGTAHKFHGPAGVGFIYAKDPNRLTRLIHGGDQEFGLRAGTENLAGIVGAGVAAEIRRQRLNLVTNTLAEIRDSFESKLCSDFPWIEVNGGQEQRVCNTSNLHFRGIDGQALMAQLDAVGIQCSQSSACTNLRPEPSYVLRAMGLSEKEAYASVRFSFGETNTITEIDDALAKIVPVVRRLHDLLV